MAVALRLTDSGLALIVHVPVCALEWLIYRLGRKGIGDESVRKATTAPSQNQFHPSLQLVSPNVPSPIHGPMDPMDRA
jgi:hypothetical protein